MNGTKNIMIACSENSLMQPDSPGYFFQLDQHDVILNCNQNFTSLFDCDQHENIIGKPIQYWLQRTIQTKHNQNQTEERWLLKNQQHIVCLCQSTNHYDESQQYTGKQVTALDITEYKQQQSEENALLQTEKQANGLYLKNIIKNLADHVFWQDEKGTFLGCNDQQAVSVGLNNAEDLIGKTLFDIAKRLGWESEMVQQLHKNDLKVMQDGNAISFEEEIVWADGQTRTFLSKKAPLRDDENNCIGLLGLAFDITERKQMENTLRLAKQRADNANLAKSNFIANISHDLRTPLHTMLGIAELMQIKKHMPEQVELLDGIIQSGQSLLTLVEQTLEFSEIETKQVLEQEHIDLRQLIENIILQQAEKAKKNNIDLIISYGEDIPRHIKGHVQYLQRILNNLLDNAIKFTTSGHILVAVEPVETTKNQATLQIMVEDTGIGISSKDIRHIFDRFYRADPSYTSKFKGSGLGLAIAKQLTERIGGSLQVNSQLGIGTTFSCTLTFTLASHSIDYKTLKNQFCNAKILIVDDHAKRRETLLKQFPCKHKLALTSIKAVDLFMSQKTFPDYNLIIIDDNIKAMQSDSLANVIHSLCKQDSQPLLVLVSKIQDNCIINKDTTGFQQLLSKPIQPTEISHRLAPSWEKWQEMQQRKHHTPIEKCLNILLVEDEPLIQRFTKSILLEFGCNVHIAKDGTEALNKTNSAFDLIFMDIGLPDMNGIEVTQKIRQPNNINHQTPIVALTAHVSDEDKSRCLNAGVNDFLTKPASYSTFRQLLTKYQKG